MKQKKKKSRAAGVTLSLPRSLLVFETTGFQLYGMVARCAIDGSVTLSTPVSSASVDFGTAVAEVVERLRAQEKKRFPKTAVLITPSAAGELLPLPVNPGKPRPRAQMKELVRWELEEGVVRQQEIWSLGAVLQGRGAVTAEERRAWEIEAEAERGSGSVVQIYRDRVTREQLEEGLAVQEMVLSMDDELLMGWSPPAASTEAPFLWSCAGIGEGVAAQWVKAFKQQGIFCSSMYPQLGAGFPRRDLGPETYLWVEIRQEQWGLFQEKNGRVDAVSTQPCRYGTANPETISAAAARFISSETRVVYVSALDELLEPISRALQQALEAVEIRSVPVVESEARGSRPVLVSLESVARVALKRGGRERRVRIPAQAPRPPIWKSRTFWPWILLVLLGIGLASHTISMRVQTHQNNAQLAALELEYERRLHLKNDAHQTQSEINQLGTHYAEKEQALNTIVRSMEVLETVIRYRQELVPGLLQAIGKAIPAEVQLDVLEEDKDRAGFYLEGWALRDTEAQRFGNRLNDRLAPWSYKVGDLQVSRGMGRLGIEGFIFKVRLIKIMDRQEGQDD